MLGNCQSCDRLYLHLLDTPDEINKFIKRRQSMAKDGHKCNSATNILTFGEYSSADITQQYCELIASKLITSTMDGLFFITNLINYMNARFDKKYNAVEIIDFLYLVPEFINEKCFTCYMQVAFKIASPAGLHRIERFINSPPHGDIARDILSMHNMITLIDGEYRIEVQERQSPCNCA